MYGKTPDTYTFKSFRLEIDERQLLNNGVPIPLTTKAFDVLAFLVERSGHLVRKEELIDAVWPDSYVEESSVARIVHTLRRVLGEDQNVNKFIETVAKKGYRFVAEVTAVGPVPVTVAHQNGASATAANENWPGELSLNNTVLPTNISMPAASKRSSGRLLAICLALLVIVLLGSLVGYRWKYPNPLAGGHAVSIAVLPLKALNGENQDLTYRLGIAESLISRLASAKGLAVRPLNATWGYIDQEKDVAAIGKEQKVDYVLASTYQMVDGKLRVNSQLINTETSNVDDSFKSDRDIQGVFATQDLVADEVGGKILKRFGMLAGDPVQARGTPNEDAYRLFLQGSYLVDKRKGPQTKKAIELLDRAIELDPNFAKAYAARAYAYRTSAWQSSDATGVSREDAYLKAKVDIEAALRLAPRSSEAYVVLGEMKDNYEWKFDEAEAAHLKSIELDPLSAHARRYFALHLMDHGRCDEALEQIKTAIDLEPASVFGQRILAQVLYYSRRYDDSVAQFNRVIEMDPTFTTGLGYVWKARLMKGDVDGAYSEFRSFLQRQKASDEILAKFDSAFAADRFTGVFRLDTQLRESGGYGERDLILADPIETAAQLGEVDKAIGLLEKEVDAKQTSGMIRNVDPLVDPIRSDSRFKSIIDRTNPK
ncbi:MAG: winged helix-turn-helix domain-containing protein [Acidobacteriota bacterium]